TPTWCRPPQTSRPGPPSAPITRRMAPSASSKPCRPVPRAVSTAPCSSPDPGVWLKTQCPSPPSLFATPGRIGLSRGRSHPMRPQSHTKATPKPPPCDIQATHKRIQYRGHTEGKPPAWEAIGGGKRAEGLLFY